MRLFDPKTPWPYLNIGLAIDIPDAADLMPQIGVADFTGTQRYRIVLVGEKSSLADVLGPVAAAHGADLYLPTGEISDTLLHQMAAVAADDSRPMVVLYFSDADPSGWQMPISVARKLQAFKTLHFPELEFEVHRVALLPDQMRSAGCHQPLKPSVAATPGAQRGESSRPKSTPSRRCARTCSAASRRKLSPRSSTRPSHAGSLSPGATGSAPRSGS